MIDAEKIINAFDEAKERPMTATDLFTMGYNNGLEEGKNIALALLKELEVKTGKWIEQTDYIDDIYYDCSACGESWMTIEGTPWVNGMNYCPHCGAKMESVLCDNRQEGW